MCMSKLHLLKVILTDTFGLTIKRLSRIVRPDTSLSWSYNSWSPQFTWTSTAARWTSATRSWSCPSWKRAATPGPRISPRLTSGWSWLAPFGKELKIKVCCYFIPFRCLASSFLHKVGLCIIFQHLGILNVRNPPCCHICEKLLNLETPNKMLIKSFNDLGWTVTFGLAIDYLLPTVSRLKITILVFQIPLVNKQCHTAWASGFEYDTFCSTVIRRLQHISHQRRCGAFRKNLKVTKVFLFLLDPLLISCNCFYLLFVLAIDYLDIKVYDPLIPHNSALILMKMC